MEFIFDTNAYRNLVRSRDLGQSLALANHMNNQERQKGHTSAVSIIVLMELIQHLEDGDPFQEECYKALCLAYYHTRIIRGDIASTPFYPPMNVILAQAFFNQNSKYFDLYNSVGGLFIKLVEAKKTEVSHEHQDDIKTVRQQILFEKGEFKANLEEMVASFNSGVLDWSYMSKNKPERKKYFENLHNGRFEHLIAISLMQRAHQVMDSEEFVDGAEEKFEVFRTTYQAAILMNMNLLEAVGHGVESLQDINDPKWNTLSDMQIMFGLLYSKSEDEVKRLVTEEKKIREAAAKAGVEDKVITLQEYLEIMDIDLD